MFEGLHITSEWLYDAAQWMPDAKCGNDPIFYEWQVKHREEVDLFESNGAEDSEIVQIAKAYCSDCPVRQECLHHGLKYHEEGIWGGLTERQRNVRIRRAEKEALRFLERLQEQSQDGSFPNAS